MFKTLHNKIIDDYSESYDEPQTLKIYLSVIFSIVNFLWNSFYTVLLITIGAKFMALVTFINACLYLLTSYLILFKKTAAFSLYLMTITVCFYVLGCSYFCGYYKSSYILLIPLFVALHTFTILDKSNLKICGTIIASTYILELFFRYNINSIYENSFMFIEVINISFAVISLIYILYARFLGLKFLDLYRQRKKEKLSIQSKIDALTELWNRTYMEELFQKEVFEEDSYLILADIDFFKKINDTYGHITGDKVLVEISKEFKNYFREEDHLVRWGGEEFLFYIKNIKSYDIINKLEEIRSSVYNKTIVFDENKINITLTFGVKHIDPSISIKKNIELADKALYFGKNNGRNQIVYYEDIPVTEVENYEK